MLSIFPILNLKFMAASLQFHWVPLSTISIRGRLSRLAVDHRNIVPASELNSLKRKRAAWLQGSSKPTPVCGAAMKKAWSIRCLDEGDAGAQLDHSSSEIEMTAKLFYHLLNNNKKDKLLELITDDCCYEDLVFYVPFQGKVEVWHFLEGLMDAMGSNVKFKVEVATEGRNNTASVIWHLEWRKKKIPFTTGYSYFEFQRDDKKLSIKNIRGIEELPIKPGDLLLKLLKAAITLFDRFPELTERVLHTDPTHDMIYTIFHLIADKHDQSNPPSHK